MNFSQTFRTHLTCATLFALLGCGTAEDNSKLKTNPTVVNRYNATGEAPLNGAWLSQVGTVKGSTIHYYKKHLNKNPSIDPATLANPSCIVFGPYLSLGIPGSGVSHFDGRVLMKVGEGSVTVDLVSGGQVHASRVIQAPFDGAVDLNGPIITQPAAGIELRVCNPTPSAGQLASDEAARPRLYEYTSNVTVSETQIIMN